MQHPLRRSDRHGAGGIPSAAADLGALSLLHGPQPLEPTDRQGAGPRRLGCAGDDRTASARAHYQGTAAALDGEVEIGEVYVTAKHKGNQATLAKRSVPAGAGG